MACVARCFKSFALAALFATACTLLGPGSLHAQVSPEDIKRQFDEVRKRLPATATPTRTPVPIPSFASERPGLAEFEQEATWFKKSLENQKLGTPQPILGHIRGKEGVPFPSPEAIVPTLTPTPVPQTPTSTPTATPTPTPFQRPPACEGGKTSKQEHHPAVKKENVLYDLLFISRDLLPGDPSEAFGSNVSVYPYDLPVTKGQLLQMEIYRVPCLPYRVRMTTRMRYVDTGNNALRNYDKDPAGRGDLSKLMQQKLFGQQKGANRR
jgi:hypothetical protein